MTPGWTEVSRKPCLRAARGMPVRGKAPAPGHSRPLPRTGTSDGATSGLAGTTAGEQGSRLPVIAVATAAAAASGNTGKGSIAASLPQIASRRERQDDHAFEATEAGSADERSGAARRD